MKRILIFGTDFEKMVKLLYRENASLLLKVLELVADTIQTPFEGLGKPEPLKGNLSGCWSRRINQEHRLIYRISDNQLELIFCFGH